MHGALLSGQRAAAEIIAQDVESVIIIGAGVAGLAAAKHLVAAGRDVQVLEARDRIGAAFGLTARLVSPSIWVRHGSMVFAGIH